MHLSGSPFFSREVRDGLRSPLRYLAVLVLAVLYSWLDLPPECLACIIVPATVAVAFMSALATASDELDPDKAEMLAVTPLEPHRTAIQIAAGQTLAWAALFVPAVLAVRVAGRAVEFGDWLDLVISAAAGATLGASYLIVAGAWPQMPAPVAPPRGPCWLRFLSSWVRDDGERRPGPCLVAACVLTAAFLGGMGLLFREPLRKAVLIWSFGGWMYAVLVAGLTAIETSAAREQGQLDEVLTTPVRPSLVAGMLISPGLWLASLWAVLLLCVETVPRCLAGEVRPVASLAIVSAIAFRILVSALLGVLCGLALRSAGRACVAALGALGALALAGQRLFDCLLTSHRSALASWGLSCPGQWAHLVVQVSVQAAVALALWFLVVRLLRSRFD